MKIRRLIWSSIGLLADVCFVTDGVAKDRRLDYQLISEVQFGTFVSPAHPLAEQKEVPIEKVIENDFVAPSEGILGKLRSNTASDGWRDDKFLRKVVYTDAGLCVIEELLRKGLAVGYLPVCYGQSLHLKKLKIKGCEYFCRQKIYMAALELSKKKWLRDCIRLSPSRFQL